MSTIAEIRKTVSDTITTSNSAVSEQLVQAMVDKEMESRLAILSEAVASLENTEAELAKVKCDEVSYNQEGEVSRSYSAKAWETKTKLEQRVSVLTNAIESAISDTGTAQDWTNLQKKISK